MRIGILELLYASADRQQGFFGFAVIKQYASIMPQAISVWCRQQGHEVYYATYFGQKDPKKLLPQDLDVVFISAYTQASALACALAKLFRQEKTLTIIGGPHAKQFPRDCLRFFDVVVGDCDQTLIQEILRDQPRGQILSSGRPLRSLPSVQERMPEISTSAFLGGRPFVWTSSPVLASLGCPNACDFCIDWNNPYTLLPLDQLEADMRFIFKNFPKAIITFHDPHFAVKFDQLFEMMEKIPHRPRNRYVVETSLSMLRGSRLERLKKMGNFYLVAGLESWNAYSHKAGMASGADAWKKMENVAEQFKHIKPYVAGIQANLLFGLDTDSGEEPIALTKAFVDRVPFVVPTYNIPVPFGNTPLYEKYLNENRLLTSMPFSFYYMPYLVYRLKHYSPLHFYEKYIDLFSHLASAELLWRRLQSSHSSFTLAVFNSFKTYRLRHMLSRFRAIADLLRTDSSFRAFHEGGHDVLPEYYHHVYERSLGPYAALMSREDRKPRL
jgi:hypothetical protein